MNVLFLCDIQHIGNPFVSTLMDGIEQLGVNVFSGIDGFWSAEDFDILHIQWPEAIWDWKKVTDDDYDRFTDRIDYLKRAGKKIVYTKHNETPHTLNDGVWGKLYRFIEENADTVCHLGPMSIGDLNKNNVVVEHHVYESLYKPVDKQEARKRLGIKKSSFVILAFGSFRTDAERKIVVDGFNGIGIQDKVLLAPGLLRKNFMSVGEKGVLLFKKLLMVCRGIRINLKEVSDEMLPYYFSAADVAVIQRVKILNSGNLPMAYYFGLPVVGPDMGNVGYLLKKTGNYTFDIENPDLNSAICRVYNEQTKGLGERNREYALANWTTLAACKKYKDVYLTLLQ